jgi:hypothetical protein
MVLWTWAMCFSINFDVHVTVYLNTHLSNFAVLVAVLLFYDFW